ncbi:unnamed protein product [Amoebophrya sp. A120]|nr:unnamed protein product [Amoebophrya sp. A120]|eukprot:GSA120T00004024001.1
MFPRSRKAVFVTLEYADPIFSGNGVYSRSIVQGLLAKGFDVLVLCGTDGDATSSRYDPFSPCDQEAGLVVPENGSRRQQQKDVVSTRDSNPINQSGRLKVVAFPLKTWRRLDRGSDWEGLCTHVEHNFDRVCQEIDLLCGTSWRTSPTTPPGEERNTEAVAADQHDAATASTKNTDAPLPYLIAVDWTGAHTAARLQAALAAKHGGNVLAKQFQQSILFVFRIFCASTCFEFSADDRAFYRSMETKAATEFADKIICCSTIDCELLKTSLGIIDAFASENGEDEKIGPAPPAAAPILSLNPPLREGFEESVKAAVVPETKQPPATRSKLLCCCRLSPEKRVDFFVDVLCTQKVQDFLRQVNEVLPATLEHSAPEKLQVDDASTTSTIITQAEGQSELLVLCEAKYSSSSSNPRRAVVVPYIIGSANTPWAQEHVIDRLRTTGAYRLVFETRGTPTAAAPGDGSDGQAHQQENDPRPKIIIRDFMAADELRAVFKETILNFHPALYDSYAMTIVEAAACGTPSLLHRENTVGAADVLGEEGIYRVGMTDCEACADRLIEILKNELEVAKTTSTSEEQFEGIGTSTTSTKKNYALPSTDVASCAQRKALAYSTSEFSASLENLIVSPAANGREQLDPLQLRGKEK